MTSTLCLTADLIVALQDSAKPYLVGLFKEANLCIINEKGSL